MKSQYHQQSVQLKGVQQVSLLMMIILPVCSQLLC